MPAHVVNELEAKIAGCMLRDQPKLAQRLRGLARDRGGGAGAAGEPIPNEDAWQRLVADADRCIAHCEQRRANLPKPAFPDDLPVSQRRQEIARAIAANQVVILCGETGSGKTTQLPKICLELGRGVGGMIGHTQPRRIAARTVAARIAAELNSPLGRAVGYKIRFNDKLSPDTAIKIMTDGILLAETQGDRDLLQYDTIIIDEAHERSLNIDFLLGYLKQLLPRRPDLKVIITSATIDPKRFSKHFDDAPIIEVSGRVHPVDVRYRPVQADEPDEEDPTVLHAILSAVDEVAGNLSPQMAPMTQIETEMADSEPSSVPSASSADVRAFSDDHKGGDILIFLSGEREIREAAEALRKHHPAGTEILPLYARLSTEEQNRIFQPHAGRRIVLATNVAETSLTVPGIRYVIDLGFARISRYSANARVQRLPIEPVSRASSDQRKGRCGRLGPGVCIRLYSEPDYADRPEFTDPEILRANLAAVILQMKALRLGEIERFPFIDPPRPGMIREGYQTLLELGAVDDHGRLTRLGGELARLPVDPRIGRMILAAREEKCLAEALIIASALATQDARLRPMDAQGAADLAHQRFADESSDFLSYLKLWDFYHEQARHLSTNKLRKVCQQHYLSYVRMREWHDVHQQLHALATESGMRLNDQPAASENIHQALLTGLLNNVGLKTETHEYTGPRERKFNIFPGSGLFKKGPKWIMAAELVETNRLYARTVARIHPEWIERLAGHLLKRAHSEPHWNERSAHVEAFERITLHGLVIVPRRRVHFGAIDPAQAREIFIHQGLVEGQLQPPLSEAPFFQHNRALMQELRGLEAKTRRRNVMVNEEVIFNFYDRHVPAGVFNGPLLQKWRRQAERENPGVLFMARQDLTQPGAAEAEPDQFPDAINVSGVRLPLTYRLEPGDPADGVTMVIPIEALHQVGGERADWLVPGLLQEKIAALIKTLPKEIRRNFVPAPEYAELAAKSVPFGAGDMLEAVGEHLHRRVGVAIPRDAWRPDLLPDHLRMNYAVLDAAGQSLATGRDLNQIKRELEKQAAALRAAAAHSEFERRRITEWTFDDLPERVEIKRGGITIFGYPALIDDGDSVSIQLVDSAGLATTVGRAGLRRLFALQVRDELAVHIDYLPNIDDLCLLFAPLGGGEQLKADLIDLVADRVFIGEASPVRTQTEFERRLRSGWSNLWPAASELGELVGRILTAHHAIDLQLDDAINPLWNDAISDIRAQVGNLMPPRFLINTPQRWLSQYPRYLAAVQARLRKLVGGGLARDARATAQIAECWQRFEARLESHRVQRIHDPELELYRWMIEELRVSLFAQELGTAVPVSAKRLEAQWAKVRP